MSYKLHPQGVVNLDTGMFIPEDLGDRYWRTFIAWRDAGNKPEPEVTLVERKAASKKMLTNLARGKHQEVLFQASPEKAICDSAVTKIDAARTEAAVETEFTKAREALK